MINAVMNNGSKPEIIKDKLPALWVIAIWLPLYPWKFGNMKKYINRVYELKRNDAKKYLISFLD